ncbi:HK97 family phage prohead protease [Rhodococcus sp. ZPP]|uniref:HK97 family phage prohead protease n=1 Tax=Rhodococcus sp. ZPP TaxID=2749906 RepID=UPI001AD89944|nr:HK97 family phage prohead protease [Rhodococcus sp. ZPP]QTJ64982.1 HK97 family phage prohead protease [Rhodococcus sp. ZPP]
MATTANKVERPPTESVLREAPFSLRASDDDGGENDGLTLDGYGAVFNRETIIDSWEGKFREKIAPGSMKKSFRETPPKIQFDHGRHPMIGSVPIAKLERIAEESDPELAPEGGAHIVGRVFDNWLTEPIRDAIAAGAIDGMSFRFSVVKEQWQDSTGKVIRDEDELMTVLRATWYDDVPDDELPIRTLQQLKVPEMGPVTWPAYSDTSVSVRSQVIDLGRLHEPGQRKLLAQAVFIADMAESDDDAQQPTPVVGTHPPKSANDAQRSTSPRRPAGKHSSPTRGNRPIDVMVRKARDTVLSINTERRSL